MDIQRREFVGLLAAGLGGAALGKDSKAQPMDPGPRARRIRAIAFDGFVLFDVRQVAQRVEEQLPGNGVELTNLWRTRQFEYTWLRTAGDQYADFWQVTNDALRYTATSMKLSLTDAQHAELANIYRSLAPWPDVADALAELRKHGMRMAFLSDFTAAMLDANLQAAKLGEFFEPHLSTDRVRAYKPSPRAYQMGLDAFGLQREEIAFAAFGAWDAVGAKWFGYPTVWVNRLNVPAEELGVRPDVITPDLSGLLKFVGENQ